MFFSFAMFGVQMNGVMKSFWYLLDIFDAKFYFVKKIRSNNSRTFFRCLLAKRIGDITDFKFFLLLIGINPPVEVLDCEKAGKW